MGRIKQRHVFVVILPANSQCVAISCAGRSNVGQWRGKLAANNSSLEATIAMGTRKLREVIAQQLWKPML